MRLIDADALKSEKYPFPCAIGVEYAVSIRAINDAPTIAPKDLRPRGRWERVIPSKSAAKWCRSVSCSVCHMEGYKRYNYCPNCGARMEEGNDS